MKQKCLSCVFLNVGKTAYYMQILFDYSNKVFDRRIGDSNTFIKKARRFPSGNNI